MFGWSLKCLSQYLKFNKMAGRHNFLTPNFRATAVEVIHVETVLSVCVCPCVNALKAKVLEVWSQNLVHVVHGLTSMTSRLSLMVKVYRSKVKVTRSKKWCQQFSDFSAWIDNAGLMWCHGMMCKLHMTSRDVMTSQLDVLMSCCEIGLARRRCSNTLVFLERWNWFSTVPYCMLTGSWFDLVQVQIQVYFLPSMKRRCVPLVHPVQGLTVPLPSLITDVLNSVNCRLSQDRDL